MKFISYSKEKRSYRIERQLVVKDDLSLIILL